MKITGNALSLLVRDVQYTGIVRWGRTTVIALSAMAATASAEPARTNAQVSLHSKPGEKQPVVAKLPANTAVTIEAEAGRWLRVRAGKVVGYLTRTQLNVPAPRATTDGAWAAKAPALAGVSITAVEAERPEEPAPTMAPRGPVSLDVAVGVGYRSLAFDFSSATGGGLSNYLVSADAAAGSVALDGAWRAGRVLVGGDASTGGSFSSPGIEYMGPSAPAGKIPFRTAAVDGGVRAGLTFPLYDVALRAGVHYDAFLARDVENVGKLPRERLLGATLGLRGSVTPPTSRVSVGLRVDVLAFGSRAQTPGLEDGESSTARAVWAGATLRVALARHLALVFAYDFSRASTHWSGMSVRDPGVSDAHRTDSSQLVQLGVGANL